MKISLFDVDEFIEINKLQEVKSPVLFERGGIPNPEGLISNEIFGINIKSRKETFAYIDLHGHFFHPHIYKVIKRVFRNVDKIINGEKFYSIDSSGKLFEDPVNGSTGISFLYNNWTKIKWEGNGGMSSERTDLISKTKKNEVWISKEIVIPAFYRDIKSNSSGGGETSELNNLYSRLIRYASVLEDGDMFDFSFHTTNYNMQKTLVDIYNYFKDKLDKKSGLLRKYLMGKNVDYAVRTVISTPIFNTNKPEDNIVDFRHTSIPLAQVCVLVYPFIVQWVRNFFEKELIENQTLKYSINSDSEKFVSLKNPESYFNDQYVETAIDRFTKDPASRFDLIEVPTTDNKKHYLIFQGFGVVEKEDTSPMINRYMTWTDILYMAAVDVVKDKHCMITRYPILDAYGIFISKVRVSSTIHTVPMRISDRVYKWYPDVDLSLTKEQVSNNFIDTTRFSNSYLKGLDGDYDGDQITTKIFWTQEANEECAKIMNKKSFILSSSGKNMRTCDLEAIQTFYTLTKEPTK